MKSNCWIKCSDQLPEKAGNYLCAYELGEFIGITYYNEFVGWYPDKRVKAGNITHWQTLPEPPNEA